MKITPALFEAYLKCPTKCWLRFTGEPTGRNAFAEWVQTQSESYRVDATKRLTEAAPADECAVDPATKNMKSNKWRLAVGAAIHADRSADSHVRKPEAGNVETRGLGGPRSEPEVESRLNAIERIWQRSDARLQFRESCHASKQFLTDEERRFRMPGLWHREIVSVQALARSFV